MGFTKLLEEIITSSIMAEPPETFKVWIALLALAKHDGIARTSIPGLAGVTHLPINAVVTAIETFKSPDKYSRSKNDEGRRIKEVDGGFFLINYKKHRDYTYSDTPVAIRQRNSRAKKNQKKQCDMSQDCVTRHTMSRNERDISASASVSDINNSSINNNSSISDTSNFDDTVSNNSSSSSNSPPTPPLKPGKPKKPEEPLWKTSFEEYLRQETEAYQALIVDQNWIEERQKFFPSVDISLSLEKAHVDYWSTKAGWKKKKASRTIELDWKVTYRNALDQPMNRVYKPPINRFGPKKVSKEEIQRSIDSFLERHKDE